MKPTGYIDATFTEWLTQFVQATSALPFGSVPRAVHCRSCGAILDGIAASVDGIASQQARPMSENDNGLISFWSEPVGAPILHRRKPFQWRCRDCTNAMKLVPPLQSN